MYGHKRSLTHHPGSQGWASRWFEHFFMSMCKVFVCQGLVVLLLWVIGVYVSGQVSSLCILLRP